MHGDTCILRAQAALHEYMSHVQVPIQHTGRSFSALYFARRPLQHQSETAEQCTGLRGSVCPHTRLRHVPFHTQRPTVHFLSLRA